MDGRLSEIRQKREVSLAKKNQCGRTVQRKSSPCTNTFDADAQFVKCKFYRVDVKKSTHILRYYESRRIRCIIFDEKLDSPGIRDEHASCIQ